MDIFYKPETNYLLDNLIETKKQSRFIQKQLLDKDFTYCNNIMLEFIHNISKFQKFSFFYEPNQICLLKRVIENKKEN